MAQGEYPARNPKERLSDLRAQVAANRSGIEELLGLEERYGKDVVEAYMGHILDNGEEAVRELLAGLPDGTRTFSDHLDDGSRIQVTLTVKGSSAILDFTGTAEQQPGNLNAPTAVTRAATLYVLRCLTKREIPLNGGCIRPVQLKIPEGSLLSPRSPAAVVGGNVETSQRVVDVLLGAFGATGASQGTMNNLTFGTGEYGYYETVCGGAGAGLGFDGAHAVHTHMTNTRITDPEVLEYRYPVRLQRFARRKKSGGSGTYRGGDGVVREIEFLEPMTVSLLGERRSVSPFGLHGAGSGKRGMNALIRKGAEFPLPGRARLEVVPQDRLLVITPGAGGYEPTPKEWAAMPPEEFRSLARKQRFSRPTSGVCAGRVQMNMIVLPEAYAEDFEAFCKANSQACPLLERLPAGVPLTSVMAHQADVRTDLPKYRIFTADGSRDAQSLNEIWSEDCVTFLLGCSFTFEGALTRAGLPVRHIEQGRNVPMYRTSQDLQQKGPFGGKLVVSMRPYPKSLFEKVSEITGAFPQTHGAPVGFGNASEFGVQDLDTPDWGDAVSRNDDEEPVFWACGVSSQEACLQALEAKAIPWFASHAPGHMLIGDLWDEDLRTKS